ncbi:MAG: hypothetical protein IJ300_14530, partial [Clostridia bacterium]|nr:hypothetical protein [Clostridia bacterium]
MCDYQDIAELTMDLLKTNTEWEDRYAQYADNISARSEVIKKAKSAFRCWKPFGVYISTSDAKDGVDVVKYSLRYKGQHIAELKVFNGKVTINTDNKTAKNNSECFKYHKKL